MSEYMQALAELQQAQQNFEYAEKEYIDVAVNELNAALKKVGLITKELGA